MLRILVSPGSWLLIALGLTLWASPAHAGTIAGGFEEYLGSLSDTDLVSVICHLREQAPVAEIDLALKREGASRQERHARVIRALQSAQVEQSDLLSMLASRQAAGEVVGYTSYWIANLVVVQASKRVVLELAERDDVAFIEPNFRATFIDPADEVTRPTVQSRGIGVTPALRAIRADLAWYELGATGYGRLVANLDSGVDGHHEALSGTWRGNWHPWEECWLDVEIGGTTFPEDPHGHGTLTMGLECGLGAATGDTTGVAWGARWIASNGMVQDVGPEFDNDVIAALQWFSDPDGDPGTVDDVPDVLQNSWGVNEYYPGYYDCDSRWWVAIDNCEAAGVVTIWSAGNSGPSVMSIISPADRITTPLNALSVGAVDATSYGWPYPIWVRSSRGPSGCDGLTIKPELVAPGVQVYGPYMGGYLAGSGTSWSAPHVSGTVALMREVNPDLEVDAIKQILLDTARDLGDPGEDNSYGHGILDARAAVLAALGEHGTLTGIVRNASGGLAPIAQAMVEVEEIVRRGISLADGHYTMALPPGTYTVTVVHPHFAPQTLHDVIVVADEITLADFSLTDIAPPEFTADCDRRCSSDPAGPYEVTAVIRDDSPPLQATLYYRLDGGAFTSVPMSARVEESFVAQIPGQPIGTLIEFYVEAVDAASNTSVDPPGAPAQLHEFRILPHVDLFADDMESGQGDWSHHIISGQWDQWHLSTYRNHTPGGETSWKLGDTDPGLPYRPGQDAGLVSPSFELPHDSYLHYWQWIAAEDAPGSDFAWDGAIVEISLGSGDWMQIYPDGGYPYRRMGTSDYVPPPGTPLFSGQWDWHEVHFSLGAYEGSARLRFRFFSDSGTQYEGWYVDDVRVEGFQLDFTGIESAELPRIVMLHSPDPNPVVGRTMLRYSLPTSRDTRLTVCDATGRVVRRLTAGLQAAGLYEVLWDGRDDQGLALASGVYFLHLAAGPTELSRKVVVTR